MKLQNVVFTLIFFAFLTTAVAVQVQTRVETKTATIELNTQSGETKKEINLEQYQLPAPEECQQKQTVCEENSKVFITIEKSWKITKILPLNDPNLTTDDFINFYPDISSKTITSASPKKEILILQRVLYERGLLSIPPTGKLGAQTERAILHLQQIKNIEEWQNGRVQIGPKTIHEINQLKKRMENTEYLQKTIPPALKPQNLTPKQQKRLQSIDTFITADQKGQISEKISSQNLEINFQEKTADDAGLKLKGFVKIER